MKSVVGCVTNGIIAAGIVLLSGVQGNSPEFWRILGLCCLMMINSAVMMGEE